MIHCSIKGSLGRYDSESNNSYKQAKEKSHNLLRQYINPATQCVKREALLQKEKKHERDLLGRSGSKHNY